MLQVLPVPTKEEYIKSTVLLTPAVTVVHDLGPHELVRLERQQRAQAHRATFKVAIDTYDVLRREAHDALRVAYDASVKYSALCGGNQMPEFNLSEFININMPELAPTKLGQILDSGFTTTQAGMATYQSSLGKDW